VDGADWTTLGTTHEFARAPGSAGYASNTTVDFSGVAAKYVRITPISNWGGILAQYGLSEVRFSSIPLSARRPDPDPGATDVSVNATLAWRAGREADVSVNATLAWRAGREAATHDVYLSTDEQAVIDGNVPTATVADESFTVPPLDLNSRYYWRIDEVNDAETPSTWQGDVWDFTTQEYLVVEDFESYNDIEAGQEGSKPVYTTWVDGFDNPSVNGSTIGYTVAFQPSMETTIVYDGEQSVPLFYNNTVAASSEVTANVADLQAGQDWAKHTIKALTLRFHGDPNNSVTDQMYVKINGSKVTYDGDATNLTNTGWQMWYIDLASVGVDLNNVATLSIGFERAGILGGQGVVYLDGIRLYPNNRLLITPADPGTTGLQAHYEFEGNTNDSSGNARHGTPMGNPTFVAGKVGQAANLFGADYVVITGYKGILGANPFSISAWIKTALPEQQQIVYYGTHESGLRCEFRVHDTGRIRMGNGGGQVESFSRVDDGGWHHVVATISENSTNSSSDVRVYIDGLDNTRESTDLDPPFGIVANVDVAIGYRTTQDDRGVLGQIDDVRIYDRVLSPEEAAWLAGRAKAFDKPF
ncbi:MAG: LamG domain-containing protein, partial [Planctomycetota bacterium]